MQKLKLPKLNCFLTHPKLIQQGQVSMVDILVGLCQMYTIVKGIPHYDGKCDGLDDPQRPAKRLEARHQQEQYSNNRSKHTDQDSPITRKKCYQHHAEEE